MSTCPYFFGFVNDVSLSISVWISLHYIALLEAGGEEGRRVRERGSFFLDVSCHHVMSCDVMSCDVM